MNKILILFIFVSILMPSTALAQEAPIISIPNPLDVDSIPELIAAIGDLIFVIGIALVGLMIVIGALLLITAAGDPGRIATAKRLFFWTGIGTAVILLAKGVSGIIKYILGGG